jgi:hypothetical protein
MVRLVAFLASSLFLLACSAEAPREETASRSSKQESAEGVESCPSLFARFCDESNGHPIVREYSIYGLRHADGSCRYWGGTAQQVLETWPRWGASYGDPTGVVEVCESSCDASVKLAARCE